MTATSDRQPPLDISHRIATFYSYKGGVGRSMVLANIAFLLARDYGLKVLVVDWDLEAPGLHRYFNMSDEHLGKGVIDYLDNYKALMRTPQSRIKPEDLSIKQHFQQVYNFGGGGSLYLLGAGLQQTKSGYADKVRGFDWENFYREWNGAQVIEGMRKEFTDFAHVTLIDSRTGITDVGGVCTVQLPDIVVFVFVFNEQNLSGVAQIAKELSNSANPSLKALQRKPELLFLPCRKELSEIERLRGWEADAAGRFERFSTSPKITSTYGSFLTYLRKAAVPYVPYYAYGEELAARSDKGVELVDAFQPLIGLLLGDDLKTTLETAQRTRLISRRRIMAYVGIIALSIALLTFFIFATTGQKFLLLGGGVMIAGAVSGVLGASLYSISRFQMIAKRDPWKLNLRFILLSLLPDIIGGGIFGAFATIIFAPRRYYLLASLATGFLWRPVLQRLTPVSSGDSKSTSTL